ncbi:MAG: substrate-binding domain-containing protein [Bacteroidales bacterium]
MNKIFSLLIAATLILAYGCRNSSNKNDNTSREELTGTISISGSSVLYPMAQKWAEEFQKLYPNARINVTTGSDSKSMTDALTGAINIGMLSRGISKEESDKGAWFASVAKYVVVPIVNQSNPVLQQLMFKGLKKEILKEIFITGKVTNWDIASGKKKINEKINVYKCSDASSETGIWAKYLGGKQDKLLGAVEAGSPELTQAVKNDNNGIGFTTIGLAYDPNSKYENSGIKVLPIDFNGNGVIDDKEYFYQHKDSLFKAIADGRFPSSLAPDLYFVCKTKPTDKLVITFIKWILSDGQKIISDAGFVSLPVSKAKEELKQLE